jgi:hypothetical protein
MGWQWYVSSPDGFVLWLGYVRSALVLPMEWGGVYVMGIPMAVLLLERIWWVLRKLGA